MYRIQLTIDAKKRFGGVGILTRRLHAYLFQAIRHVNPELSELLHQRKQRQMFSIFVTPENMIVHSPKFDVIQSLQQYFSTPRTIHLIDWVGQVQNVSVKYISREEMMSRYHDSFTLRFLTPTTFYQSANYYPLPELGRLFSSAAKVLAMSESLTLLRDEIDQVVRNIRLEHVDISTKRVRFGSFQVIGFCGSITCNLKALPVDQRLLYWRLAVYGSLMGFGYKTAWGLGQSELISPSRG